MSIADDFDDTYAIGEAIPRTRWRTRAFFAPDQKDRPWVMWRASDFRRIDGVHGPIDQRISRKVGQPTAAVILRTWRLRPS